MKLVTWAVSIAFLLATTWIATGVLVFEPCERWLGNTDANISSFRIPLLVFCKLIPLLTATFFVLAFAGYTIPYADIVEPKKPETET